MKNSVVVLFELNWGGLPSKSAFPDEVGTRAYEGIKEVAEKCDPDFPLYNDRDRRFFVLTVPPQQDLLCKLIGCCTLAGHQYKIRWFGSELT